MIPEPKIGWKEYWIRMAYTLPPVLILAYIFKINFSYWTGVVLALIGGIVIALIVNYWRNNR